MLNSDLAYGLVQPWNNLGLSKVMGRSDKGYGSVGPILFQTRPKFVKKFPRKVECFFKNQNLGEPENELLTTFSNQGTVLHNQRTVL